MTLDLTAYQHIYTSMFVRIDIPQYAILRMSTHFKPYNIVETDSQSYTYTNLGQLLSVSDSSSEIRATPEELTLTIAGIPNTSIADVVQQAIKGSRIECRTVYFNGSTWQPIATPVVKFKGIINNYSISEEYPSDGSLTATSAISLIASTLVDLYSNKLAGRRTNPLDQKTYYPNDLSMDRVPTVTGSSINFGAPR